MQILVRHDDTIHGSERLTAIAEATIGDALRRFAGHITTVECHFADENAAKVGGDIRCTIEVRFEGKKPIAATHHATDLPVALDCAAKKVARMLDHQLGRIREYTAAR